MNEKIDLEDSQKWQILSSFINQHSNLLPTDLAATFKKLVLKRWLAGNVLVFLLQYISLTLSTLAPHPTPLWLASGTACAFIFLRGVSILPGIWLGSVLAYLLAQAHLTVALGCATIFMLQAFVLLRICYRYIYPTLLFYRAFDFIKFIITCAAITAIASFLLEMFCYSTLQNTAQPEILFLEWWLANFNGIMVFSSAIIAWDAYFPQAHLLRNQMRRSFFYAVYGLFITVLGALLFSHNIFLMICSALATLPLIIIIARWFTWCGVISAICLFALSVNFATGLFFNNNTPAFLIFIQLLLILEVITSFLVTLYYSS